MASESNYRPSGKLQGDDRPMSDHGGSTNAGYKLGNSMGGKSKADLKRGYCDEGGIGDATKSDKPDFA